MNSPWLFVPPALCASATLAGLAFLLAGWLVLRRKEGRREAVSDDLAKPPTSEGGNGSPGVRSGRWIIAACLTVSGVAGFTAGIVGLNCSGFTIAWVANPPEWTEGSPELTALIRRHCRPVLAEGRTAGLCVGVVQGTNAALVGLGRRSLNGKELADGRTLFEIGSITKTFTALALARQVERGALRLDQPVSELLPAGTQLPEPARGITLRQLTTHSSGMPRMPENMPALGIARMLLCGGDPYAGYGEADLLEGLRRVKLESKPGTKFEYSNFGVAVLGYLLARRSGLPYETLVRQEICEPLGMRDTTVTVTSEQGQRRAQGYRAMLRVGQLCLALRSKPWFEHNNLGGAGALRSTGRDMLAYLRANMHPDGLALESVLETSHRELFRENEATAIGMNWIRSRRDLRGQTAVWHNGGTGGFCSFLGFTEDGRTGVVVLSNSTFDMDGLGWELLEELNK